MWPSIICRLREGIIIQRQASRPMEATSRGWHAAQSSAAIAMIGRRLPKWPTAGRLERLCSRFPGCFSLHTGEPTGEPGSESLHPWSPVHFPRARLDGGPPCKVLSGRCTVPAPRPSGSARSQILVTATTVFGSQRNLLIPKFQPRTMPRGKHL